MLQKQLKIEGFETLPDKYSFLKDITTEPIVMKLSDADYFDAPGVSQSDLKVFMKSPYKYYDYKILGNKKMATKSMSNGTLLHTAILEPEKASRMVSDQYLVDSVLDAKPTSKSPRATSIYKELKLEKENAGYEIVTKEIFDAITEISSKINKLTKVKRILDLGLVEHCVFRICPDTGLLLKGKMDVFSPDLGTVVDLKSTQSAELNDFMWSCEKYKYYVQAAFYLYLTNSQSYYYVAVEMEKPYCLSPYLADEAHICSGNIVISKELKKLKEHYDKNSWPDYFNESDDVPTLGIPERTMNAINLKYGEV